MTRQRLSRLMKWLMKRRWKHILQLPFDYLHSWCNYNCVQYINVHDENIRIVLLYIVALRCSKESMKMEKSKCPACFWHFLSLLSTPRAVDLIVLSAVLKRYQKCRKQPSPRPRLERPSGAARGFQPVFGHPTSISVEAHWPLIGAAVRSFADWSVSMSHTGRDCILSLGQQLLDICLERRAFDSCRITR